MAKAPSKEKVFKAGLGDPRGAAERTAGLINRALSGNRKAPGRAYDDAPAVMAKNRGTRKR
jgi:hypothetical protein